MADAKLSALTATTAPVSTDLAYLVVDPGGTPASRKCTLANLFKGTLPTLSSGQYLTNNGTSLSWGTPSGLSWGTSIAGTTTGGVTLTLSDSSDSGAVAQSIVMGDTQANALVGQSTNIGSAAVLHNASVFYGFGGTPDLSSGAMLSINNYTATTQSTVEHNGIYLGKNFNRSSAVNAQHINIENWNNTGGGQNTGVFIKHQGLTFDGSDNGAAIAITTGSGFGSLAPAIALFANNNNDYGTYGQITQQISGTQDDPVTMHYIDVGGSARDHLSLKITGTRHSIEIGDSDQAPGTTTNKLYAVGGNLFWNGVQLN